MMPRPRFLRYCPLGSGPSAMTLILHDDGAI